MENLRIMAENLGQKKEIISSFVKIGYIECECCGRDDNDLMGIHVYSGGCIQDILECDFLDNDHREITLQQLKDMVVLKRNSVDDATHTDQYGDKWICVLGIWYFYSNVGEWDDACKNLMHRYDLKPIKEEVMKETLNDKVASAEVARQELKGVEETLAERQSTYGSFTQVANTTGQLMAVILNSPNGHTMPYAHEEALHMICSKIARIVNGDINHADSWHDIGGYAKLIEDIIQGEAS